MIAQRDFERTAMRGDLPPAPRFCRTAELTDLGVVLGEGIVLAPLTKGGDGALVVEGREAEIFALLSLAQGGAVRPNVLYGIHGVSKALARGEIVGAMIRLAQIGLPALRGPRDAEMLKAGAVFLDKGFSPWAILQAAAIEGANVRLFKAEWSEDLHPRDPATGQFIETGGVDSSGSASRQDEVGAKKPGDRSVWSSAMDAATQWLQTPVSEYDTDTGEQVGTRPRWQAIATNPIAVGAVGAAALLGGEALLAPAGADGAVGATANASALNPNDFAGKTASEIDRIAQDSGLLPKGPNPTSGQGAYIDPITGEQRVLIHPESENPHIHVNDPTGARLDINGNIVPPESPSAHLPLGGD